MEELNNLLKELEDIKIRQKSLARLEENCRADIFALMQENAIQKEKTNYGTISIHRKYKKLYGASIETMEKELKEAKKLADDLGDYETMDGKDVLVYVPPAELF